MENGGFQSQLLSVMEVLAKAAVAEIDRRVDDSCAVLRLEVSRGRRDIELLKSKCELMEAEMRRSRTRARRRAAERFFPSVKVVVSREKQSADWDGHVDVEAPNRAEQCAAVEEFAGEAEHIQIKEELAEEEEDLWRSEPDDGRTPGAEQSLCFKASPPAHTGLFVDGCHSAEDPTHPESFASPAAVVLDALPEQQQQLDTNHNGTELVVKLENQEEPYENAPPPDPGLASVTDEGDDRLWLSDLCGGDAAGDPGFSFAAQRFEHIPVVCAPQSGLRFEDMVPRIHHPGGKSHSVLVSAARAKRRARTFACKRPQAEVGNNALSQLHATGQGSLPQQQQYRDFAPGARSRDEDATAPAPASPAAHPHPSLCGHSRGSLGLGRRMAMLRAPWRSGEKRFSCTYCDKSFMRFSQLKEHLRSHTGEKPYSCLQCGRSFTKQCNLIRHAVVHSGEKPHACSLCGKCFTQRSSLKSHQKTAH